jgi:hypothetical protein
MRDMADLAKARIPDDDLARQLTVADTDSAAAPHVAVVGDVYTILVSGAQTAGRYCLIDMVLPPGGGRSSESGIVKGSTDDGRPRIS